MAQTEDIEYNSVDEFAIADEEKEADEEEQTTDTQMIKAVRKYLREEIIKSNTLDVLNLPQNATVSDKIAAYNEAAIHKGLVMHLRNLQQEINNIIKEN